MVGGERQKRVYAIGKEARGKEAIRKIKMYVREQY
jgi:hypothetical protein